MKKMRKIVRILKTQDAGDMGIGAMIVFIAMVLVAGIAASVLVQTANKLEIQAMTTGRQTTDEVSTGLAVIDIEGRVAAANIHDMTITVKARAGSKDVDLAQTVIELTDGTTKVLLSWRSTNVQNANTSLDSNGNVFDTGAWNETNEEFGFIVLNDADSSITTTTPVINRGDIVMLCVHADACFAGGGLDPRDDIYGKVMPEEGSPGIFAFTVPASLSDTVYDLY
jgi:archaeal flagellin FlaB